MLERVYGLYFAALARLIPLSCQISKILRTGSPVVGQNLVATIQTGTVRYETYAVRRTRAYESNLRVLRNYLVLLE